MDLDWSVNLYRNTKVQTKSALFLCSSPPRRCLHGSAKWVRQVEKLCKQGWEKRPIEFESFCVWWGQMWAGRKCWACKYIGQAHPYIHILKSGLMLTATIKWVLSMQALALWPICWWSESNDAVLLWAIKQGGGNCRVKVTPKWRVVRY